MLPGAALLPRGGGEGKMVAQTLGVEDRVSAEELIFVQMLEAEALLNILERKGLLTKAEVLDEVRRLKAQVPKAR